MLLHDQRKYYYKRRSGSMKTSHISFIFVDSIPSHLDNDTLYISMSYATAIHKCCCGCGQEVVTPFSPTDWELIYDGVSVSLFPSIGNWSFRCQSHYWIENNNVKWTKQWHPPYVQAGRIYDRQAKDAFYKEQAGNQSYHTNTVHTTFLRRLWQWLMGK